MQKEYTDVKNYPDNLSQGTIQEYCGQNGLSWSEFGAFVMGFREARLGFT
jgi:hypothetical protein